MITRTSTRVWAAAEVHDEVCGERASPHDGERASPHDGERASPHDGARASLPDGARASLPDGERASLPDGERASPPDGEQASLHDGEQELRGGRYGLPDRDAPQGVPPTELFPASRHRKVQEFFSFSNSFIFPFY